MINSSPSTVHRLLAAVLVALGLAALYPVQRWIDSTTLRDPAGEEVLYISSGEMIKRLSLGLEGLAADVYWIRTVQYFGRKILEEGEGKSAYDSRNIRMDLLAPLLNIVVTLDPHHISAYRFGAIFLPERDPQAAIDLLERGIRANPREWRFYQDLGYIYWQAGDYQKAAEWYDTGSSIEGAAWWMRDLAGVMRIKGGSRDMARAIYEQYYRESDDPMIRSQAVERLLQLRALDEIDAINGMLSQARDRAGSCPASLRPLAQRIQAIGIRLDEEMHPLDPAGFPYRFDNMTCKVSLSNESPVPR
jgi:tetratricopeptide (TPR) repeat protein